MLFIKTSSLGDVVHHMPAVTDIRRQLPDARLDWVVEESFAPLARLHPAIETVIPVATRRWRGQLMSRATWQEVRDTLGRLRTTRYDLVIDTQGLIRSAVISRLASGERHGYDASSIKEPLAARFYDHRHSVARDLHAVARNRLLTAAALGYAVPDVLDYGLSRPAEVTGAAPLALLVHGTSRLSKEWPESNWIELGCWLQTQGFEIALPWGTQAERERSERLAQAIPGAQVLARQGLGDMARIVATSDLVVGVDTGLLHLAAAYQVPLAGLYVATAPGLTGPVGQGPIVTLNAAENVLSASNVIAAITPLVRTSRG